MYLLLHMATLADLHGAVQATLASKRLGVPVFVRYQLHSTDKANVVLPRLTQLVAVVRDWLGQVLLRLYALGNVKSGQVTLTLEFRGGATALVSWTSTPPRGDGVDLLVLGNHGAIYHDSGSANLWDEPLGGPIPKPEAALLALIEQALRSGRPETFDKGVKP
jgi:hypothetical protein